jgi:hypothetical protein
VLVCYYIDNDNLTPLNRGKVLGYVRQHVRDTLRAPERAMVVSYERRPRVVTPFTWNSDRIVAGLDSLATHVGRRSRSRYDDRSTRPCVTAAGSSSVRFRS